jgi:phospholipase/carboxylesterase
MKYSKMILPEDVERFTPVRRTGISRRNFLRGSLAALAAPVFLSCSNSPTESRFEPRLTARPGMPTLPAPAGLTELGLGQTRDGLLYVPTSYSPSNKNATPLFIALHGAGGSSENWTSYPDRAEAHGLIFLAIDSRSSTWDLVRIGFGPDVLFLDRALQYTFQRCRIDPARLALGGFSDGASYALSLGVSNGDLFSHLVGYSPGFLAPSDPIIGKPRVFISHGTQDAVLPVALSQNNIVPRFRNDGYEVTYRQFQGGHEVPSVISEAALDWFLDQG